MKAIKEILFSLAGLLAALYTPGAAIAQRIPTGAAIDAEVSKVMTRTRSKGMALAVIDRGEVGYVPRCSVLMRPIQTTPNAFKGYNQRQPLRGGTSDIV